MEAAWLRMVYSMAAFRLKASTSAVCFSTTLFPTDRTSMPSVLDPTDSSCPRRRARVSSKWRWRE